MKKLVLLMVGTAACTVQSAGHNGNLAFGPLDCNLFVCDFDSAIATGGDVKVHIDGLDGFSTAGLDLRSANPNVFDVTTTADIGNQPTWQVFASFEGVANLEAVDTNLAVVDFLPVTVRDPDRLYLADRSGLGVTPTSDANYDEIWPVPFGEDVLFDVMAARGGQTLMGNMGYDALADTALYNAQVGSSDFGAGHVYFRLPGPGDYEISFTGPIGTYLNVLFQAL